MQKSSHTSHVTDNSFDKLKSKVDYHTRLQEITNKIHSADNLDGILIDLKSDIISFFKARRITVYVVDGIKRKLISRFKSGSEITEIRIPISRSSLAGYSAFNQKVINVSNVYDDAELSNLDPDLKFDSSWDLKTGLKTMQVLVCPIVFQKYLMGAIQLINRKDNSHFSAEDERAVKDLANTIGIALYNQKRMVKANRSRKFDYLLEHHLITQKELKKAVSESRVRKDPIESILMQEYNISKAELGKALSEFYKVPFIQYSPGYPIPALILSGLKVSFMQNNFWVPIRIEGKTPVIAIDDPNDLKRMDEIKALFPGKKLKLNVALKEDILSFINLFTNDAREISEISKKISVKPEIENADAEEDPAAILEENSAIVQLVNKIIMDAYSKGASDIHIEPYPSGHNTQVRFRVDGACNVNRTIPSEYRNAVVSRIKIMADLDIAERRLPQDGKIKFKNFGGENIELRIATIPTQGGLEDVVMRILHSGEPIPLHKIGFQDKNYKNFINAITKPYGIIFVCGPTGSGKTTTLHSALKYINKTETKIWTAEDPVEITQKGLRQVQVKPRIGFDFAAAMRSFLRADPDVIMVGEMRDKETTSIGIEASLTGHLVLSTLHTNSAPESIIRLLDMGMDPFNFADAVLCILAQRLVRTLCPECKKAYALSRSEYEELKREYGPGRFETDVNIPFSGDLKLYKANGCESCGNSGYKGRMGIHELLVGTDPMKKRIQGKAKMEEIRDQAIRDGMTTLKQDGIVKVLGGHTDLRQVRKVCIK